jgi:hypothetical protein
VIKVIIAIVLFAHGVGHSLGLLQVFKVAVVNPSWNGSSWVLSGSVETPLIQAVGVVVWTMAIVGFAAAAAVMLGWLPGAWWAPMAMVSAVASLVGLALFPVAFPTTSTIGALVVDLAVLYATMWAHWTPAQLAG